MGFSGQKNGVADKPKNKIMSEQEKISEHRASIEQLLKAGTHFGHLTSRWNPKMKSFIFMKRNGIHILNLNMTQKLLDEAGNAAARYAKRGKRILFAGTKKQAQEIIRKHAEESGSPYVVERWLGGTLTNFATIRKSIRRMEELVKMEEDGSLAELKKKERLMKARERGKLQKILTGIQDMARLPGAIFVVDIRREHIAIQEARKLKIPVIAMVDTNCDPDLVDYPIPANDDAYKSIDLITGIIANAIMEGKKEREEQEAIAKAERDRVEAEAAEKRQRAKEATAAKAAEEKAAAKAKADADAEAKKEAEVETSTTTEAPSEARSDPEKGSEESGKTVKKAKKRIVKKPKKEEVTAE